MKLRIKMLPFLCILLWSCATGSGKSAQFNNSLSWTVQELIAEARKSAQTAAKLTKRSEAKEKASLGIAYANQCLERAPEEAACYYYRAVNTGLYYQVQVIGYQDGVKKMIADAGMAIHLEPNYDYAGAYRLLGELYTKLPQTTVHPDGITRNLEKAEKNLQEAVRLASDYPENHLVYSETLLAKGNFEGALKELSLAKQLAAEWKHDASYSEWVATTKEIEKQIPKNN